MRMMLAVLPFLAATALGQDDVYKTLGVGDRVQITFVNGNTITGDLVSPPSADPRAGASSDSRPFGAAQPALSILYFHQDG